MSKQLVSVGTVANDGTGDDLRTGAQKINANFNEIYNTFGDGTTLSLVGTGDVLGPGVAVSTAVAVFDGTTGKYITDGSSGGLRLNNSLLSFNSASGDEQFLIGSHNNTGNDYKVKVQSSLTDKFLHIRTDRTSGVGRNAITTLWDIAGSYYGYFTFLKPDSDDAQYSLKFSGSGPILEFKQSGDFVLKGPNPSNINFSVNGANGNLSTLGDIEVGADLNVVSGNINLGDGRSIYLGDGADLQIVHDQALVVDGVTGASVIQDVGTGKLVIGSNGGGINISKGANSENMAKFINDGPVELYYDNSKKFETTASGVEVTGSVTATTFVGDGSGLTGVIGSGSGIVIYDGASLVGTAGTIVFGDNLTVSAISSGIVTVTGAAGGGSGLSSRVSIAATTSSISVGSTANITISAAKSYLLQSVGVSTAAWVTLYTDTTSRTNDASRSEDTDPLSGSGVVAEIITSGATTQLMTPGVFGFNNDNTPSSNVYAKVVNKGASTQAITVTLTYVQLEV